MSFTRNTILSAIFGFTTLAVVHQDAQACPPRRSAGYSRGFSSQSYGRPVYNRYSTPSYAPTYSQPVQVIRQVQPVAPQTVIGQQIPVQPGVQGQLPIGQQPGAGLPPQVQPQQSALAPQQRVQPQQQLTPQQPVSPQVQPPAAMSALQALGGFAPPQQTQPSSPPQVQTPVHVGSWTAALGNGSSVRLSLEADGNFSWIATNKSGSSSSFSGTYSIGNGNLTLSRSNDNQQLGGRMTTNGNNTFSFKVAGNNAASLNFNRS